MAWLTGRRLRLLFKRDMCVWNGEKAVNRSGQKLGLCQVLLAGRARFPLLPSAENSALQKRGIWTNEPHMLHLGGSLKFSFNCTEMSSLLHSLHGL